MATPKFSSVASPGSYPLLGESQGGASHLTIGYCTEVMEIYIRKPQSSRNLAKLGLGPLDTKGSDKTSEAF